MTSDSAARREVEAHVASCVRCARSFATWSRSAPARPSWRSSPRPRDLWDGIARRIEAPVVRSRHAPRLTSWPDRRNWTACRLAAIAAALVAVTAGVTYTLTSRRAVNGRAVHAIRSRARRANVARLERPRDHRHRGIVTTRPRRGQDEPAGAPDCQATQAAATRQRQRPRSYSREIDRLRTIFLRNRSQLDPRTAAIIEANLKVIDDAIAQSKAALARTRRADSSTTS